MPYSGPGDDTLPAYVKKLTAKKRRQWVNIWNSAFARCQKAGGKGCEGTAFAQANGVVLKKTTEGGAMQRKVTKKSKRSKEATDAEKKAQQARASKYGIAIKNGGNVTKPKAYADVPEGMFGDPVNFRYPLSPPERAVNAVTRFNNSANKAKGGYTDAEWAKVGGRIAQHNKGKTYRDGQVVDTKTQEAMYDGQRSIDDISEQVRTAFREQFRTPGRDPWEDDIWAREVYEDHVIARMGEQTFSVPYTMGVDGKVDFETDRSKWEVVEQRWVPITEAVHFVEKAKAGDEEDEEDRGKEWDVTLIGAETPQDVITEGDETFIRSKNGRLYSEAGLKASVPLWEGVKVYDNHLTDAEFKQKAGMRSVAKEWVGVIEGVSWDDKAHAVIGTLKVVDKALRQKLVEASDAGVLDAIGLSIDALGDGSERQIAALGNRTFQVVEKITKTISVDVVSDPAAGGRLARLVASMQATSFLEDLDMEKDELKAMLDEAVNGAVAPLRAEIDLLKSGGVVATEAARKLAEENGVDLKESGIKGSGEDGAITEEDVRAFIEARDAPAGDEDDEGEQVPAEIAQAVAEANAAAKRANEAEKRLAIKEAESALVEKVRSSGLPKATRDLIVAQFKGRVFEAKELDGVIKAQRDMISELTESGEVVFEEGARISVSAMTEWDRHAVSLLRLLAGATRFNDIMVKAAEDAVKPEEGRDPYGALRYSEAVQHYVEAKRPAIPHPVRLSEWFYDLMGGVDAALDGQMRNKRLLEANLTTSTLSSIVKSALNIMLAADYSVRQRWWDPIVRQEDVDTIDAATLVRTYGVSGLSVINEGGPYLELDMEDEEETASFAKRGGFIGITQETFLKDKLNVLRSIPNRLANAWYNQVGALVAAVFTTNTQAGPVLADTGALFNANAVTGAGGHANLLTADLSAAALSAIRTAMRKQTDQPLGAGERLGITFRYLLIPADLETTADQIRASELVPGESGGATTGGQIQTRNVFQGKFETIVVPNFTDVDDFACVADPAMFPAIWLIWLRGRRTPELFAAEDERSGAMFTNDVIRYKVRMWLTRYSSTYDCAPVGDFRPLHKTNT